MHSFAGKILYDDDGARASEARVLKVTVKLFASLGHYLPQGAKRNQIEMEYPLDTTLAELVESLNLPEELVHLVLIDGVFIPPKERMARILNEGEEIAIFPPIAGG